MVYYTICGISSQPWFCLRCLQPTQRIEVWFSYAAIIWFPRGNYKHIKWKFWTIISKTQGNWYLLNTVINRLRSIKPGGGRVWENRKRTHLPRLDDREREWKERCPQQVEDLGRDVRAVHNIYWIWVTKLNADYI